MEYALIIFLVLFQKSLSNTRLLYNKFMYKLTKMYKFKNRINELEIEIETIA